MMLMDCMKIPAQTGSSAALFRAYPRFPPPEGRVGAVTLVGTLLPVLILSTVNCVMEILPKITLPRRDAHGGYRLAPAKSATAVKNEGVKQCPACITSRRLPGTPAPIWIFIRAFSA